MWAVAKVPEMWWPGALLIGQGLGGGLRAEFFFGPTEALARQATEFSRAVIFAQEVGIFGGRVGRGGQGGLPAPGPNGLDEGVV